MPNPIIPVPEFPNVSNLPGVPQLKRANAVINTVRLGVSAIQKFLWAAAKSAPTWGIFDSQNQQVIVPDSILALDKRTEFRVSDFPVQAGSFASYNKVRLPFETSVRMSKGGSQSDRKTFLDSIDAIVGDLNLYTILTPEQTYTNCNITRSEITRRGAGGAFLLTEVDVFFRQIIEVAAQYSTTSANTSNAQNPPAVPPTNLGNMQPQAAVPHAVEQAVATAVANTPN